MVPEIPQPQHSSALHFNNDQCRPVPLERPVGVGAGRRNHVGSNVDPFADSEQTVLQAVQQPPPVSVSPDGEVLAIEQKEIVPVRVKRGHSGIVARRWIEIMALTRMDR
jgi:hypothetical protein